MSDPVTRLERMQRRLRRHLHRNRRSPLVVLRRPLLNTRARRDRALCRNPYCPCADVSPACPEWMGFGDWPDTRCPRCGAPRENHDDQAVTT